MSKSQRGNKEAKKPRKEAPARSATPATTAPVVMHAPAERVKGRR
jgi:hypothetical protein